MCVTHECAWFREPSGGGGARGGKLFRPREDEDEVAYLDADPSVVGEDSPL